MFSPVAPYAETEPLPLKKTRYVANQSWTQVRRWNWCKPAGDPLMSCTPLPKARN